MKIAFCLFKYFPYGGLQRDFLRIALLSRDDGHDVHVYTTRWEGERPHHLAIHLIQAAGWQNHTRMQSFARAVHDHTTRERFDVIVGFNKMPYLDIYYAADPCLKAQITNTYRRYLSFLPRYRKWLQLEAAVFNPQAGGRILLIAHQARVDFIKHYGTAFDRFDLLSPGVARDRVYPTNALDIRDKLRLSFQITSQHFVCLIVASSFKTKGLNRVLQSISQLPAETRARVHLWVVGDDKQKPFVKLARQLGLIQAVRFLGARSDVRDLMLAADLLVHPAYQENTGTVLVEALILGLPVLTLSHCGYAHYIREAQAGMVLDEYHTERFGQALASMLDPKKLQAFKERALSFAKGTDFYSMPEQALAVINTFKRPEKAEDAINYLHPDLNRAAFPKSFMQWMILKGCDFRVQKNRSTRLIRINDNDYFIKQHQGIGWREIIKNLFMIRKPITSASNEYHALNRLRSLKIAAPRIFAYGERGLNPATRHSFILMEPILPNVNLEELISHPDYQHLSVNVKRDFIKKVAEIAAKLHRNGINHRDLYLCHFLLNIDKHEIKTRLETERLDLYLIDLHRAQCRLKTPLRWIIKDLASLYFSSTMARLSTRDYYRFMQAYRQQSLRVILRQEYNFWQKVKKRGRTYRDHTLS